MQNQRVNKLINKKINSKGNYICYFVCSSPRVKYNYALSYAILKANKFNKPLLAVFKLNNKFTSINMRNFIFLVQGLNDFKNNLSKLGIPLVIVDNNKDLLKILNNSLQVITDKGYLNFHKTQDNFLIKNVNVLLTQVESNVVVPVSLVSNKQEYNAYIIRPKIQKYLNVFLKKHKTPNLKNKTNKTPYKSLSILNLSNLIKKYNIDLTVKPTIFIGGESEAIKHLNFFIKNNLGNYNLNRNNTSINVQSNLSPYLHFGHISPVFIALKCLTKYKKQNKNIITFFDELIIFRELAKNYCYFNKNYNKYAGLPNWCIQNFNKTINDKREYVYTKSEFEKAKAHDKIWNFAQNQLLTTGKMHGYLRMYWGKKVITWTKNPVTAFKILVYLNDKYSLDGRDENGYAGIGWCFGLHDKPFFKTKVLGIVRSMSGKNIKIFN